MTGGGGVLAVVTARGGSKGLPRKNVLPLGGRPLIAWTVQAALGAACVGRVIVSTDDAEIAAAAVAVGAEQPFLRPAALSTDTATSADVLAHALAEVTGHEHALLLQPTSPFRTAADIDKAFALWRASRAATCVSVCAASESPWLMFGLTPDGWLDRLLPEPPGGLRRQDLPTAYSLNGALYFVETARFRDDPRFLRPDTAAYEMPPERSIDIDDAEDLAAAERQLSRWGGRVPESLP
jgi:CMP-N,N'-diacetyllegionaminic acid synthase